MAAHCGGCSTSYQLGSLSPANSKPEYTGSISKVTHKAPADARAEDVALPPASDLDYAKIAAAEVLTRGRKHTSVPWENPKSGARGTVTPLANAYRVEGALCRDFLASYVADGSESWLQGEACREGKGKWEVRRLKPWRT